MMSSLMVLAHIIIIITFAFKECRGNGPPRFYPSPIVLQENEVVTVNK
jgi:hypothetical protein